MPLSISKVTFEVEAPQWGLTSTLAGVTTDLILQLHTLEIESAPNALSVSIVDGGSAEDIVFAIDGVEVFVIDPDLDGGLDLATVPVPDLKSGGDHLMQPGVHELTATQDAAVGTAEFSIVNPPPPLPEIVPEDAPPVAVPGSVQPTGFRRWVFQDLMPGGLGSWILPQNPEEMGSPAFSRELTARTTLAEVGGQYHVYEDAWTPVEWTFNGICPTKAQREQMEAFSELNRRWYLIDHRGRAWKVTFGSLEMVPRLSTNWEGAQTEEVHDYQAIVRVMDREWVQL